MGSQELRVAKNKEVIRDIQVRVLSGLKLSLNSAQIGQQNRGIYSVQTAYSTVLSSKYQEGLLDIDLIMSDDTVISLKDVDPREYYLAVKSLDPDVIAFAPTEGARYPRIIAVGSGHGRLLRVSLELADECIQKMSNIPLAAKDSVVTVKLKNEKPDSLFDVATSKKTYLDGSMQNIALQDEQRNYAKDSEKLRNAKQVVVSVRNSGGQSEHHSFNRAHLSPLEIGMYILLSVFCAAMAIFVASCFVYASKYRRSELQPHFGGVIPGKSKSIQNAHDWVWLGKSTMDNKHDESMSVQTSGSRQTLDVEEGTGVPRSSRATSNRHSYASSANDVNVIENPAAAEYRDNDGFQQMLQQQRRHQQQQQQHVFEMSALLPPSYPRRHHRRQLPTPPPGHPAFGRHPFNSIEQPSSRNLSRNSSLKSNHPQRGEVYNRSNVTVNALYDEQQTYSNQKIIEEQQPSYDLPEGFSPAKKAIIENPLANEEQYSKVVKPGRKINSGTYTKKSAYEGNAFEEESPLPVGYPIFASTSTFDKYSQRGSLDSRLRSQDERYFAHSQDGELFSPLNALPDPSGFDYVDQQPQTPPLRQSPASALPPMSMDDELFLSAHSPHDGEPKVEMKGDEGGGESLSPLGDYVPMNPDIDRPSPPRLGRSDLSPRMFQNPFEMSDEVSPPVEPEKLSPSHVFESTSLEQSLLESNKTEDQIEPKAFDTGTFVVKKSSSSSSGSSSPTSPVVSSAGSHVADTPMNSPVFEQEAAAFENREEESIAFGMDYDNLMAYFDNLKESTA